jgi:hypothetical protein
VANSYRPTPDEALRRWENPEVVSVDTETRADEFGLRDARPDRGPS